MCPDEEYETMGKIEEIHEEAKRRGTDRRGGSTFDFLMKGTRNDERTRDNTITEGHRATWERSGIDRIRASAIGDTHQTTQPPTVLDTSMLESIRLKSK